MKKLFALILVLAMALVFVACGGGNGSTTTGENTYDTPEIMDGTLGLAENATDENAATDTTSPDTTPDTTTPTTDSVTNTTPVTQSPHTHSYVATVTAPTCTSEGYTTYKCACGDSYIGNRISPTHQFGPWETARLPSSLSPGSKERICDKCGVKETEEINKHMHSHKQELTKEPSCIEEGTWTYTCSCGDTFTESHPKVDHTYKSSTVIENCLNGGYEEYVCSVCGYSFRTDFVSRDHSYAKIEQPATCTENGYTKYTCTVCGASYSETINALNHIYRPVSCESNRVCIRCGDAGGDYYEHNWCVGEGEGVPSSKDPRYCRDCGILWCDYYGHIWDSNGQCIWTFCDAYKPE